MTTTKKIPPKSSNSYLLQLYDCGPDFTAASLLPHLCLNFDLILVKTEACWKLILCLLGLVYFQRVIYNT